MQRMLAGAARRLLLIAVAAMLLTAGLAMAGVSLALALAEIVPLWAATLIAAGAMCLAAALVAALALRRGAGARPDKRRDPVQPELLHLLAATMEKRPKTALGLALVAGIALGIDPSLRRDLIQLLKTPPRR